MRTIHFPDNFPFTELFKFAKEKGFNVKFKREGLAEIKNADMSNVRVFPRTAKNQMLAGIRQPLEQAEVDSLLTDPDDQPPRPAA